MTEFRPPISERDDLELIAIAHSTNDEWQQAAIEQAQKELARRGIPRTDQLNIIKKWKELERQEEVRYQEQLRINATQKYDFGEMLFIVIFSPLILTGKIPFKLSLRELYRENYKIKFKQRLLLLIFGIGLWIGSFSLLSLLTTHLNNIKVEKADTRKWEENRLP